MKTVLLRVAALLVAVAASSSCSDEAPLADELSRYTDPGDGCAQVVSAISYADTSLKALGQERYQDFDEVVRSKVAAVSGTIALEVRDFPTEDILEQARSVGEVAARTAGPDIRGARRVRALREYRLAATRLVISCAPYLDGGARTTD